MVQAVKACKVHNWLVVSPRDHPRIHFWFPTRSCKQPFHPLHNLIFSLKITTSLLQDIHYGDRSISVIGLFVFQFGFWVSSKHRSAISWCVDLQPRKTVFSQLRQRSTVIVGLLLQQAVALFVLKSGAGLSTFNWIARLVSDFLSQSSVGAVFFFDQETINKHWFFVNTVSYCFDPRAIHLN